MDTVQSIIEREGTISEPKILSRLGKEMTVDIFDMIIKTLKRSNKISRTWESGKEYSTYHWNKDWDK